MIAGTAALGGCAATSGYPEDPQSPGHLFSDTKALEQLRQTYFSKDVDDCYRAASCPQLCPEKIPTCLNSKQAIRDDIVLNRMHVYDMEFTLFVRDLSSANNILSLGSDLTALTLNGLGATTGDAPTKAALAAASGGVIAANGDVNKDIFYQKTVPAIIAQMEADRTKAETTILGGLAKPDSEYSLQRAELDLDTLNNAGSLNTAVSNITQQSGTAQAQSQQKMALFQTSAMATTPAALKIRAWLKGTPPAVLNDAHYDQLDNWLQQNPDPNLGVVTVEQLADVTNDAVESLRQKAISALTIP